MGEGGEAIAKCGGCIGGSCIGLCVWSWSYALLVVPVNVVAIVLGAIWMYDCTSHPVDLGVWLIVLGSVGLAGGLAPACIYITTPCTALFGMLCEIALIGFEIAWIVVGGIGLFADPGFHSCYEEGDVEAVWITALVFWCLSIPSIIFYFVNVCLGCASCCCGCTMLCGAGAAGVVAAAK